MLSLLAEHSKHSSKQNPTSEKEKCETKNVPNAYAMGSLMYVMVCIRPDIAQIVGIVSRFLSDPEKEHRATLKWIFKYLRGLSQGTWITFARNSFMAI